MSEKQIKIDEEKIESTQIVVTVKTLWTIVGVIVLGISTLFGILQSNISSVETNLKEDIKTITSTQKETNVEIKNLVEKLELRKVDPLDIKVDDIDKKVFYLFTRTDSRHNENTAGPAPTSEGPPPGSTP
jgi:hypothetical protein